jgi:hypothetical protein
MMYVKPFPSMMSPDMALDAILRLNFIRADYEVSVTNEIMVSARCLTRPEMSILLVPNIYYDLYNEHGLSMTDYTVCLNYERRYLKFYIHGHVVLDIDYQDGTRFVYPEWKKPGTIKELSRDIFGDPDFLS